MSAQTAAKQGKTRKQRRLKEGESRVAWVRDDTRSTRTTAARVSRLERTASAFVVSEADISIEASFERQSGGIQPDSEVFVECTLSSSAGEINRRIVIRDARLSDLPLIALGLQGALKVGVAEGSFPKLSGVPSK